MYVRPNPLHSISFGNDMEADTAGCRACHRKYIVIGDMPNYENSISMPWWQKKSSIEEIVINEGVTSIGSRAFEDCRNLKKVTISKTVTKIADGAFDGCGNLTEVIYNGSDQEWERVAGVADSGITCGVKVKSITGSNSCCGSNVYWSINNGVLKIYGKGPMYSFLESYNEETGETVAKAPWWGRYFSNVVIYSGVTNIGAGAFAGRTGIYSVEISDTVKDIGIGAFKGCTNLRQLQLPKAVERISKGAFRGCTKLELISEKNSASYPSYINIGEYAFGGCTSLETVNLPISLYCVYEGAFSDCTALRTVDVGANFKLKMIGKYAFSNCTSLSSFTLGYYTESIGDYAFSRCTALTEVTFHKSGDINQELGDKELTCQLESIGNYAFKDCTGLRDFEVPGFVTDIGDYAFSGCTELARVTFADSRSGSVIQMGGGYSPIEVKPSALKYLGEGAFAGCSKLSEITIPKNITTVSNFLFYDCVNLAHIVIPEEVTTIGRGAFNNSGLVYVSVPWNVKDIQDSAFAGCKDLRRITFEERRWINPTEIKLGSYAFQNCISLIGIELPNGVEDIKMYTFYNCNSLMAIGFPNSIQTIAETAFAKCSLYCVCHESESDGGSSADRWEKKRANNKPFYEPYGHHYYNGKSIGQLPFEMKRGICSEAEKYGDLITITADVAPAGYEFDHWDAPSIINLADDNSAETTFVLPPYISLKSRATIKATYRKVAEQPKNGLVEENGTWYYYTDGVVDTKYTGLAYQEDIGWWYVEGGRINCNYTGLAHREDIGWWYVENGNITFSYTGLAYNETLGWRYVENSQLNGTYTGLAYRADIGWWYVENSGITFTYNGVIADERGTWNVVNSQAIAV